MQMSIENGTTLANDGIKNQGLLGKFAKAAIFAVAMLLPTQSFAYTCFNPAICIAVCGAKTCGRIADNDPDMKKIDIKAQTLSSGASTASSSQSRAAPYTCFNPAICIAVCGKKTCG